MDLTPTLAASKKRHWTDEQFLKEVNKHLPLIVSPKLDGIRCIIDSAHNPVSRTLKLIPNLWIRSTIKALELPPGFDGELIVDLESFNNTASAIMSERGTPKFTYVVFDWMRPNEPYKRRFEEMEHYIYFNRLQERGIVSVKSHMCDSMEQIHFCIDYYIEKIKNEGIMFRNPEAPYKHGRSTLNEFYLVKYKRWESGEAKIVGFEELWINTMYGIPGKLGNNLGALICTTPEFKEGFNIGTGFSEELRKEIWANRTTYIDKTIYFKYQANRSKKNKPISPVFEGFKTA